MKTLASLILIGLAETDRAMSRAIKHKRQDVYDEQLNIRWGILSDWIHYKPLSNEEYSQLTIW